MSLIKILAVADIVGFILRFIYWEKEEFNNEISLESVSNMYFWLRVLLWICRAGFALKIFLTKDRELEFVNVIGVLIISGLIGLIGEMILLQQYWSLKKLDWFGICQLILEISVLRLIDMREENKLRTERELERKRFRRDLRY